MMLYKLTDQDGYTRRGQTGETKWSEGFTLETNGKGDLCGPGWIHAYTDPLLAVLLNPIHANIKNPVLWECEGEVGKTDHELKVGCTTLTTLRRIPLPEVTTEQRIRFGILCALEVYDEPRFVKWANGWLDGSDRSRAAARAARTAAWEAAWEAAGTAAEAATWAAWEATWAAWEAAVAGTAAREASGEAKIDLPAIARKAVA